MHTRDAASARGGPGLTGRGKPWGVDGLDWPARVGGEVEYGRHVGETFSVDGVGVGRLLPPVTTRFTTVHQGQGRRLAAP